MNIRYNGQYKALAQKLRREMTRQEKHLWYDFLKDLPVQARRQKQFGDYIVDFYIARARLVIEIDGSQHYEEDAIEYDAKRDAYLNAQGLKVMRFTNLDIDRNFTGVCQAIAEAVGLAWG